MNSPLFPKQIGATDSKVYLVAYSSEASESLWQLIVSDREHPRRKGIWPGIQSLFQLITYIDSVHFEDPKSEEYGYLIRDRQGAAVGTFHIHTVDWDAGSGELGFWLHHAFTGKGYVSECILLAESTLRAAGFQKVAIGTSEWNTKAWAVAERSGYSLVKRSHEGRACSGCDDCSRWYEKRL